MRRPSSQRCRFENRSETASESFRAHGDVQRAVNRRRLLPLSGCRRAACWYAPFAMHARLVLIASLFCASACSTTEPLEVVRNDAGEQNDAGVRDAQASPPDGGGERDA